VRAKRHGGEAGEMGQRRFAGLAAGRAVSARAIIRHGFHSRMMAAFN
jgi:hypothetical protein